MFNDYKSQRIDICMYVNVLNNTCDLFLVNLFLVSCTYKLKSEKKTVWQLVHRRCITPNIT